MLLYVHCIEYDPTDSKAKAAETLGAQIPNMDSHNSTDKPRPTWEWGEWGQCMYQYPLDWAWVQEAH